MKFDWELYHMFCIKFRVKPSALSSVIKFVEYTNAFCIGEIDG